MNENLINEIKSLPYREKEELLDYLIGSLAKGQDGFELTDRQKKELDEAYEEYLAEPASALDREEAEKEIFKLPK